MIASVLTLSCSDIKALRITDPYSLHRVVYSLFEDTRTEKEKHSSIASGILYVDKGGDFNCRKILILSNRPPRNITNGELHSKVIPDSFLMHNKYRFEVTINPTKRDKVTAKTVSVRGREAITHWFVSKTLSSWGFSVDSKSIFVQNMSIKQFDKKGHSVTQGSATVTGILTVTDRTKFIKSFQQGIGRGRAFGFGLLQIVPLTTIF